MSKRKQIVNALASLLSTVRKSNGYLTDCGIRVYPWKTDTVQTQDVPCIIIYDGVAENNPDDAVIGETAYSLGIDLVAFTLDVSQAMNTSRDAIEDMVKVVGTDPTLSGLLSEHIDVTAHELGITQQSKVSGIARVRLIASYRCPYYEV